ncbi:MAG: HD domain-containing phosphohydrolase [Phycisphaerae bacterium]
MTARDLTVARPVAALVWVAASDSIAEAAARMRDNCIGCLLVGDGRKCEGIVTERDLVTRAIGGGANPHEAVVGDVMTAPVVCCSAETTAVELRDLMNRGGFRHVPVRQDEQIVGMLSSRDLMQHVSDYERRLRELTIFSMAKLAESRDTDTGGHLERVRDYASTLAEWLAQKSAGRGKIDEEFVALLRVTSALHDIGKVSIPDCILLKPGRLSADEFELMKTHTVAGAETLGEALDEFPEARFLRMGRDIAAYHHERMDGRGYPEGLSGEDIPLAARIFALADVYDALVSRRVYKRALPHTVAKEIVLSGADTQFDAHVVEGFCACEQRFRAIQQRYGRQEAA